MAAVLAVAALCAARSDAAAKGTACALFLALLLGAVGHDARLEREGIDLLLVDISLRTTNGIELVKTIRSRGLTQPILMLSMHDETLYAERALRAGANGYVMKAESADTVLKAIRRALPGGAVCRAEDAGRRAEVGKKRRLDPRAARTPPGRVPPWPVRPPHTPGRGAGSTGRAPCGGGGA